MAIKNETYMAIKLVCLIGQLSNLSLVGNIVYGNYNIVARYAYLEINWALFDGLVLSLKFCNLTISQSNWDISKFQNCELILIT